MKRAGDSSGKLEAAHDKEKEKGAHRHAGKSSERLLDKSLILSSLGIEPGQTILDAGCGNGYMSKAFSQLVGDAGKVYAVSYTHLRAHET